MARDSIRTGSLALPGMAVVLLCLLPYLHKPYTIDDPLFLFSARQVLHHPLQPMSYSVCWMKDEQCVQAAGNLGPLGWQPLMGYALAPVVALGGAEWLAHLLQILLAWAALLAMVRLAVRFGCDRLQAMASGVLLAAIPPFLSLASMAMPDLLAAALAFNGFERLLAWKDKRRWSDAAIAAAALGLAPLARPHMALMLPFGALWLFEKPALRAAWEQLRREAWLWLPVAAGACVAIGLGCLMRDQSSSETFRPMMDWHYAVYNAPFYFRYFAYPIPFAAVWLVLRRRFLWATLGLVPILVGHFGMHASGNLWSEWPWAASIWGLIALFDVLAWSWRTADWHNRLLTLWLLFPATAVVYTQLPVKYMIGVMPAVVLILIRSLGELPRRRELAVYGAVAAVCVAYSCVLLQADADFAECGRRAAIELITPRVAAGERVWFGGQWGFYWYAQQAGATVYRPQIAEPKSGDLLAVGWLEWGEFANSKFPHHEVVDRWSCGSPHGRTMGAGGGLHSSGCGNALWVWAPGARSDYELWRVETDTPNLTASSKHFSPN